MKTWIDAGNKHRDMPERVPRKARVLFLCTGNSCRSQMAEGWANHLLGDILEAYSAGVEQHGLDPRAVEVMAEAGVDISGHWAKGIGELPVRSFDHVITVCDRARSSCPFVPAEGQTLHRGFPDPPQLARTATNDQEALASYREVRDAIRAFVQTLPKLLRSGRQDAE